MKRKNLFALSSLFLVTALTACGGGGGEKEPSGGGSQQKKYDLLVWCAEAAVDLTTVQVNKWKASLSEEVKKEYSFEITVNPVGESTAAGNMINDPEKGADIFCFAQDQLARLVGAGALDPITSDVAADVESRNDSGSVAAAKVGSTLYAFPLTSDNGYFMYYDNSVVDPSHEDNLTQILADVKAANKEVHFNGSSAWYNAAYFFAYGCESTWETDETGAFIDYKDTYNSADGLKAVKAMSELVSSPYYVDNSSVGKAGENCAVIVSGVWDYNDAKDFFGEHLGIADLPSVSDGTTEKHLGSFGGFKLMGAKPQRDATKGYFAKQLANYLTSEAGQLERFNALGWGPSNKVAQNNEKVKADPALSALLQQGAYATPQGQYPGKWWDYAGAIAVDVKELGANPADADLQAILTAYAATLDSLKG